MTTSAEAKGGLIFLLVLLVSTCTCSGIYQLATSGSTTATVNKLDHKIFGSGDSAKDTYLVFTDQGVFKNADTMWRGKFNSSDLQGSLEVGKKYNLSYYGWRVPFLSWYPNVYKAEEITEDAQGL